MITLFCSQGYFCAIAIQRYEGHIAQLLGDGLLVYFGFPQAHEDDAQRAVRTGLGIVEAIGALNTRLEQDKGITLAVRLGIHTGLVVVGEMGSSGRQEQLALGETPNVAARIQGIAQSDTLVISADTYRLIQGYFDCESLGQHDLRGISQPIAIYRILQESATQSRLDIGRARGLTPLVGREREVDLLLDRWKQAKEGRGQVVLLSGEAGIGKSRLVQVLKDHVAEGAHTRVECRSSPYFTNSALYPITDFLQRTLRFQTGDTPEQKLEKLRQNLSHYRLPLQESVPLFASLLALPVPEDQYPPLTLSPQRQRQKTLESMVAILLELAEYQPVVFILEDLHWTDPTTLAFIDLLIEQTPTACVYALLTCRPEYQPSWSHRSYLTEVRLNRLSQSQSALMIERVTGGKTLPSEVLQQIVERSDGVALFIEEMTKSILESGDLKEVDGHYELAGTMGPVTIPVTLRDSLMARLDRLVAAKAVAQYAAVIGRQFAYELLRAVSPLDASTLQMELGRLVEAEIVYQRGLPPQAYYFFKHTLIRDAAYQSLLRRTRQQYHQRVAQVLCTRFPEAVETEPEVVAHHFTEAGCTEQAITFWHQAGQRAIQRSANLVAIGHLTRGLEVLEAVPDTAAYVKQELQLHTTLGAVFMAAKGYAAVEVERSYIRALELCEQLGETPQLFQAMLGLWNVYLVRAELKRARDLAEQCLSLGQHLQDKTRLQQAHYALGNTLFHSGEFTAAQEHLDRAIALYTPYGYHPRAVQNSGVVCLSYMAWTLWYLGYPDQAVQRSQEAVARAQELSHPYSLTFALDFAAWLYQYRRETDAAHQEVRAAITLAKEQAFPLWWAMGTPLEGWAHAKKGKSQEGLQQLRQGMTAFRDTGATVFWPNILALLAESYASTGQIAAGLHVLEDALTTAQQNGEHMYEAELQRLNGELLLQLSLDNATEAEACFHQALTIARRQQAKSLELRAATSLARLWHSQGKRQDAYELLAPVYNWFTEGFDTADLMDAKALLDELAE
jgi:predicted ATPase